MMAYHSQHLLARCHDAHGLVSWLNDHLAEWNFAELAAIDESCRPRRVRDVHDIAHWHRVLTEGYCAGGVLRPHSDLHYRMMDLFAAAHVRARELGLYASSNKDPLAA